MFKNLVRQLKMQNSEEKNARFMTSSINSIKENSKKTFLKCLSEHALNLYQKKSDVKRFTNLVISDPENKDYELLVGELFANKDVVDTLSDDEIFKLSENKRFLDDLGL